MEVKTVIFQSNIAMHEWEKRNYPFISILSVSDSGIIFGYEVSSRLKNPNITVSYIEFPREYP